MVHITLSLHARERNFSASGGSILAVWLPVLWNMFVVRVNSKTEENVVVNIPETLKKTGVRWK